MKTTSRSIFSTLDSVRRTKPIVLNLTNYVAMDFVANGLLAVGASPMMAFAEEEMDEIVRISGSLSLNIGTLDSQFISRSKTALRSCAENQKPCVLDPVGCGASRLRTQTTCELLESRAISILRGNGSEIHAVSESSSTVYGVDSTLDATDAPGVAEDLARRFSTVVVASGKTDLITDGKNTFFISNGHPLMAQVTGMGCLASSICGAFAAVEEDTLHVAVSAMAVMGICGEIAAQAAATRGPGSFRLGFLDALAAVNANDIDTLLRLEIR